MGEQFSWGKFFSGIVDPVAYFKTLSYIIKLCVIALVVFGIYCLGVRIHNWLTPKKQQPVTFTVNDQAGGNVKNSADLKTNKFGILNF